MTLYDRLRSFLQHINLLAQEYWRAWETDEFPVIDKHTSLWRPRAVLDGNYCPHCGAVIGAAYFETHQTWCKGDGEDTQPLHMVHVPGWRDENGYFHDGELAVWFEDGDTKPMPLLDEKNWGTLSF